MKKFLWMAHEWAGEPINVAFMGCIAGVGLASFGIIYWLASLIIIGLFNFVSIIHLISRKREENVHRLFFYAFLAEMEMVVLGSLSHIYPLRFTWIPLGVFLFVWDAGTLHRICEQEDF